MHKNPFSINILHHNAGMRFLAILMLLLMHCSVVKAQVWSEIEPFPGTSRDDGVAFLIGNTAYFGTGLEVGWNATGDFHAFNIQSETWTPVAPLPAGKERQYAAAFSDQIYGYVVGGVGPSGHLNDMMRYTPATNTWEEMAPLPAAGRSAMAYFTLLGEHYIVGGRIDENTLTAETWRYLSGDDVWQQVDDYPGGGMWRAGACAVGNLGYVGMGINADNAYTDELYSYSRTTEQWTSQQAFSDVSRAYVTFSPYNSNLFAFGGIDVLGTYQNELWRYDVNSQVWEQMNPMPSFGRKGGMGVGTDFGFYYTTGINADDLRLNETWKAALIVETVEAEKSEALHLYPNPAGDKFWLGNVTDFASANVDITDLTGRILLQSHALKDNSVDISLLPKGMYLVQIRLEQLNTPAEYATLKLVKQ